MSKSMFRIVRHRHLAGPSSDLGVTLVELARFANWPNVVTASLQSEDSVNTLRTRAATCGDCESLHSTLGVPQL